MDAATQWATYHAGEGDMPVGYHGEGGSGGSVSIPDNSAAYDTLLKNLPKAQDVATSLNGGVNSAFQNYLDYVKGAPTPLDTYTKISAQQGIPQMQQTAKTLQGQIFNLEDALGRVPENVAATTGNSIVTQAQREGIINEKSQPLQQNLSKQSTAYGRVSDALTAAKNDVMNLTSLSEQGVQNVTDALKEGISVAQDNAARSMSGFTADNENILNITLAKIHRGEQISDQEAQDAFDLLKMQKQYNYDLALQQDKSKGGSNYVTLSEGEAVYDPTTGKVVYKNPKTSTSGGSGSGYTINGGASMRSSAGF